jgi:hypothetical protein
MKKLREIAPKKKAMTEEPGSTIKVLDQNPISNSPLDEVKNVK